jgi:hypothetical protein
VHRWVRAQWSHTSKITHLTGVVIVLGFGIALPWSGLPHFFDPYTHTGFCMPGGCSVSFASWEDYSGPIGQCTPQGASYEITALKAGHWRPCFSDAVNYDDFIYQANMTIDRGNCGGLLFRAAEKKSETYQFTVCRNGSYSLYYYTDDSGGPNFFKPSTCITPNGMKESCALANTSAGAINQGLGQPNLIAVKASGSTLSLYVNHVLLTSVTDKKISSGHIGAFADSHPERTHVTFSGIEVWPL